MPLADYATPAPGEEALMRQYSRAVGWFCRSYFRRAIADLGLSQEEAHQLARIGLLLAARKHVPGRSSFLSYAVRHMKWLVMNAGAREQTYRRRHVVLNPRLLDGPASIPVFDRADRRLDVADLLHYLSGRCLQIIRLRYFDRLTRRESAKVLGVTIERARQVEMSALGKLRRSARWMRYVSD